MLCRLGCLKRAVIPTVFAPAAEVYSVGCFLDLRCELSACCSTGECG